MSLAVFTGGRHGNVAPTISTYLLLDKAERTQDVVKHHLVGAARVGDASAIELGAACGELLTAPSRTIVSDKLDALSCGSVSINHQVAQPVMVLGCSLQAISQLLKQVFLLLFALFFLM